MSRLAIWPAVAAGAFSLVACANIPHDWRRADGLPIESGRLELDIAACKGEAAKSNMAAGRNAALHPEQWGYSEGMLAVYRGCMADRGLIPVPNK